MEVNAEEGVVKYSKLIEQNAEQDKKASLILSQKTIDKLKPEKLDLEGIENNNYPSNAKFEEFGVDLNLNFKGKQRNIAFKTLVGLSLTFLLTVTGLITGLFLLSIENQSLEIQIKNLEAKLDSKHQLTEDLLHSQNLSQAQIDDLILQNKDQLNKYEVAVNHLKNAIDDKGLLHEAIKTGDVEKVKLFLRLGANVNNAYHYSNYNPSKAIVPKRYKETPLHFAAKLGQYEITQILLQHGADVNAAYRSDTFGGETPLHEAAGNGYTEMVELLIQNGADINASDIYGNTPLHLAANTGNSKTVEVLLKHGARKDLKDGKGSTPLEEAEYFKNGEYQKVIALLKNN